MFNIYIILLAVKKGLNGQSNSSSDSHQLMKNPHSKIPHSPIDLNAVWKSLVWNELDGTVTLSTVVVFGNP